MIRRFSLASIAALFSVFAANAEAPTASELAGEWVFETQPFLNGACTISGSMTMAITDTPGQFTCTFTAHQSCVNGEVFVAEQSCTAQLLNGGLLITSTVESVDPPEIEGGYFRDNFVLAELSAQEMTGQLASLSLVPVRFWRDMGAIS